MFDIHKNLSDEVIKKFGEEPQKQLDILQEECSALIQAISKYRRGKPNAREKIIEEMTHVLISSSVSAQLMGITQEDILHEQRKKAFEYGVDIDELDDANPLLTKNFVLPAGIILREGFIEGRLADPNTSVVDAINGLEKAINPAKRINETTDAFRNLIDKLQKEGETDGES